MAKQQTQNGSNSQQNKRQQNQQGGGSHAGATQGPQSSVNSDKGSLNQSKGR